MPQFTYTALDKGGRQVSGHIQAPDEGQILDKLRGLGYFPLSVARQRRAVHNTDILAWPGLRIIFHRIKIVHLMSFTRQLSTLLDAGVPLVRSLGVLRAQAPTVLLREKIDDIIASIESGSSLSEALARHPKVFDRLYVNMVRAGEIGGVLETVLNRLAEFIEKSVALRGKIKSALMYPLVVSLLAAVIVTFILVKIIPVFEDIFRQLDADLPLPTQMLIYTSSFLLGNAPWVLLSIVCLIVIYRKLNQTQEARHVFDRAKLRLPVFGELLRKMAIVRFAGTFATLIHSGVPILQALEIVRETSGNEVVSRALGRVYHSVRDGETIHEPLAECPVFPPLVVQMVAVGEETGAIDLMMTKVAEAYEREVDNTVNALTAILEPLLLTCLGLVIGMIVVALYMPLFILPGAIK